MACGVVDDVACEAEGAVRFDAGALGLKAVGEGEDVVADDIFFAVVLVETAGACVVDEVVFHEDAGGAFVGVEAPAAVGVGIDVVEDVVGDEGAL